MKRNKPRVYVFGWPSFLGGADTKLAHLLWLLHKNVRFTVIPNDARHLANKTWTAFLDRLRIPYLMMEDLPSRLDGFALSLCNNRFFTDKIALRAKEKGLTVVWSSEMMWHHRGEKAAVKKGLVDKVLYVSELQKSHLEKGYRSLPWVITGNYVHPESFPFKQRRNETFTIGRLSRPAPEKYPEDFPVFYECLELPHTRFRVMAWDSDLKEKYRWHRFDERWDLLEAEAETQLQFLHSLDLFVYPLGHRFKESWGRSTVEAMLTGSIPLAPARHHLDHLIVNGETGFICSDFLEYKEHAHMLYFDYKRRKKMSQACHEHAKHQICDAGMHRKIWMEVFQ